MKKIISIWGAVVLTASLLCGARAANARAAIVTTAAAAPQGATGRLTGEVTDKRGTPLAGSSVAVTDASGKQVTIATTDANGAFTVDSLPEGEYILRFDAKGFYKKTQKARVKAGKTEKVHARMKFIPIQ
jgi:5-hydroxyisourate hydrolase-like protein (transthyretin family)